MSVVLRKPRRPLVERESGQLRETWLRRGHDLADPIVRELIARGVAPVAGGAMGKGASAFFINLPPDGTYQMGDESNPQALSYFNQETERNDVPQQVVPFSGLGGSRIDHEISNVGILANLRMLFEGTLTVSGSGTVTTTYQWPWNLPKKAYVSANGQTTLLNSEGLDIRCRRQRLYRNPKDTVNSAPNTDATTKQPSPGTLANGSYPVNLFWDFPIVHDPATLTGALFAQSDENYLQWTIEPAAISDLFTVAAGGAVALTGNFFPLLTFYDIPYVDVQGGRQVVIPDLRWLHGFLGADLPFNNTGDVEVPLVKTSGQLLAHYLYIDNGGAAQISPALSLDEYRLEYGGNRKPSVWRPTLHKYEEDTRRYNGSLEPGYVVLDLEYENPDRDLIYPRGLSALQVVPKISAGVTLNANSHVHFCEETLFSGV